MVKNIGYRVFLLLVCVIVVIYYNIAIPLINGIIQLKINILGFFLEPLLQWTFDVSLRQAQIISAWIYLLIAIFLFGYFLVRISQTLLANIYAARHFWFTLNRWQKLGLLLLVMMLFGVIGKVAFLFF